MRVAVAGAGIYGATIALHLARGGHAVSLFDPLGVFRAASAINQYRVHSGYHYPRSPETIREILEAKEEFLREYREAIVRRSRHYYAIPRRGSRTPPREYERVMSSFRLPLRKVRPPWMNFDFIDICYEVEEKLYDPAILRRLLLRRLGSGGVSFHRRPLPEDARDRFGAVVYATYGLHGGGRPLFKNVQLQVAEKILIQLPRDLERISLVVVDGPFTAFDPFGNSRRSLFGSALHTNHWKVFDLSRGLPTRYRNLLNRPGFEPVSFTHFSRMVADARKTVPLAARARYLGSRFTLRFVEYNPARDRRILRINQTGREINVFSGKVVSAVKAARLVAERIDALG